MVEAVLIGLMGPKGGGKDTVCRMIQEAFDAEGKAPPVRFAFADKLKDFAYALDPIVLRPILTPSGKWLDDEYDSLAQYVDDVRWDQAKNESEDVRRLLQRLGTEAGREVLGPDIWVDAIAFAVEAEMRIGPGAVLTDVRFPNEIGFVRQLGGSLWRIDRPSAETGDPHPSEVAWRQATPDVIITNDGDIEGLEAAVYGTLADLGYL